MDLPSWPHQPSTRVATTSVRTFSTIEAYYRYIGFDCAVKDGFSIGRLEDAARNLPAVMKPYRKRFYKVMLILDGSLEVRNDLQRDRLERNQLFFSGQGHVQSWRRSTPLRGYVVYFTPAFYAHPPGGDPVADFPFFQRESAMSISVAPRELGALRTTCEQLVDTLAVHGPHRPGLLRSYLDILLRQALHLYEDDRESRQVIRQSSTRILESFRALIRKQYGDEDQGPRLKTVSEFADAVAVHPDHLNYVVREATGSTALQMIHEYKLLEALTLLRQTDQTVSEIAFRLHFDNPTHFTRFVKRKTGRTPTQHRKAGFAGGARQ